MFLMATVAFCMSFSGLPQPPWLACEHIQSPVLVYDQSKAIGPQCRMAIQDRMGQFIRSHPESGWWVAGVNCQPISARQMG